MKKQNVTAARLTILDNSEQIRVETEEIQDRIRRRAFEISMSGGHTEVDNWVSAESEIISVPPIEIAEREGAYSVQLAIAGINPEDLHVMTTTDSLLVMAEFRHAHDSGVIIHHCDFKPTTVFRSARFPGPIDLKTVKLQFNAGLLQVSAQKHDAARQTSAKQASVEKNSPKARRAQASPGGRVRAS